MIAKQNVTSPYPEIYPGVTKVLRGQLAQGVEENIFEAADKGDLAACRFILTTLGKARGYSTRKEIEQPRERSVEELSSNELLAFRQERLRSGEEIGGIGIIKGLLGGLSSLGVASFKLADASPVRVQRLFDFCPLSFLRSHLKTIQLGASFDQ